MSQTHAEHFDELATRFGQQRQKQSYFYSVLSHWLGYVIGEGKNVLELGCADGNLLKALKPARAVGIDFSSEMLKFAQTAYPESEWLKHDLDLGMPEVSGQFDCILGADIVGYLQDIQGSLESVARFMQPETRLVLTKINPLWGPLLRLASRFGLAEPRRYANWLTLRQCTEIADLSGFELIKSGRFCLFPVYIPLISAFFNRIVSHLPFFRRFALVEYLICRKRPEKQVTYPSLSVIIPARNERGNIRAALERMPKFAGALEVIFVEGHSSDDTWNEIQKVKNHAWPFSIRALQQTGKGKGDAVRLGFEYATGDLLMILDADLTVPPEELPRFYNCLADHRAEYVHGTRLIYPMENQAMRPLNWFGNKFFSAIFSFLLEQPMSDTLCGTKCLWRSAYGKLAANRSYFGDFDPFGDYDLIFGAAKLNLKISEIPVHYKARTYGETQISRFRDGLLLIRMCWFAARKIYFL